MTAIFFSFEDAIAYHVNEAEGRDVEDGLEAVVLAIAALRFMAENSSALLTADDLSRQYAADFYAHNQEEP